MADPVRLRLSRARGFNLQKLSAETNGLPAVVVARPSRWGNPWIVSRVAEMLRYQGTLNAPDASPLVGFMKHAASRKAQEICVTLYREALELSLASSDNRFRDPEKIRADVAALRGKNLACWCKPGEPCHADVLLDIANRPVCEPVIEHKES